MHGKVQKKRGGWWVQQTMFRCRHWKGRRMRNLHGDEQQDRLTQLQPCHVLEMLPRLVLSLSLSLPLWFNAHLCVISLEIMFIYNCRRTRSQSCPFCRDSLKRVNSGDLWVFMDSRDVIDMATLTRENLRRLFMYIDKLPLIVPDMLFDTYDSHIR